MEYVKSAHGIETIIKINSFKDLSPTVLKQLQEKFGTVRVQLVVPNRVEDTLDIYTPRTYRRLYYKLQDLTDGIDDRLDDPLKFLFIYRRLSKNVVYDYPATKFPRKKNPDPRYKKCRNLEGPLLEGKAVCSGFADTLKAACDFKNVPCVYIDGMTKRGGHSWNQVCLHNKWIGVDCTWDIGGRMKYCSIDPQKFNDKHDYDSLMEFAEGDNHLLYQSFDWSKYLNRYLGLNTDCTYSQKELEYYYDLLEGVETRGENINQLMNDIRQRIRIHAGVKAVFRSARYDYDRTMKLLDTDDVELYQWIKERGYHVTDVNSRRIVDEFARRKVEENRAYEDMEMNRMQLKDYKSLNLERWASRHGINYNRILDLRMNQDELYNIIHSKDKMHRIRGAKTLHVRFKMAKSEIMKLMAKTRIGLIGLTTGINYSVLHDAGVKDEDIIKGNRSEIAAKIVVSYRALHSQENIDAAVAASGTSYEKLRRIGLTDYVLNELGQYRCKPGTIKELLEYKIDGQKNLAKRDRILRQLDLDMARGTKKTGKTRNNIETDEREEGR